MDPAVNLYYPPIPGIQHINRNDATYVDIIHTDGGGYGTPKLTGTADFYVNTGRRFQPGCPVGIFLIRSDNGESFEKLISDDNLSNECISFQIYVVIDELFNFGQKVCLRHLRRLLQQCSAIRLFRPKWATILQKRELRHFLLHREHSLKYFETGFCVECENLC